MTDKERLKEIKLLVEELTYEYVHDDTFYGLFVDIDRESIDLLIEQAEIGVNADKDKQTLIKSNIELNARVQELKERDNEITKIYGNQIEHMSKLENENTILQEQNKRYRKILSYVREIDCIDWNKEELAEMARKALEESK